MQDIEMRFNWLTENPFSKRRLADKTMAAASRALPEAMRQVREATPNDQPIDPDEAADIAMECALALAARFTDSGFI